MVTSLGLTVNASPRYDLSEPFVGDLEGMEVPGPFQVFPMTFTINGERAFNLDLVVAETEFPWTMTSGIVAFRGRHPSDDTSVRARLIGASSER